MKTAIVSHQHAQYAMRAPYVAGGFIATIDELTCEEIETLGVEQKYLYLALLPDSWGTEPGSGAREIPTKEFQRLVYKRLNNARDMAAEFDDFQSEANAWEDMAKRMETALDNKGVAK